VRTSGLLAPLLTQWKIGGSYRTHGLYFVRTEYRYSVSANKDIVDLLVNVAAHQIVNMKSNCVLNPMAHTVGNTWVIRVKEKSLLLQILVELVVPE
jgi:hypothetical protein